MQKLLMYMKSGMRGDSQRGPVTIIQLAKFLLKGTVEEKASAGAVGTTTRESLVCVIDAMDVFHKLAAQERARAEYGVRAREKVQEENEEEDARQTRDRELQQQKQERLDQLARALSPPVSPNAIH